MLLISSQIPIIGHICEESPQRHEMIIIMNHLAKTKKNQAAKSKGIITKGTTYTLMSFMFREDLEDLFAAIQSIQDRYLKCIDLSFFFYRPIEEKDN